MPGKASTAITSSRVALLSNLGWREGDDIVVEVQLTAITQEVISFDYKLSSSHTEGYASDASLILSNGVTYDSIAQKIIVPIGVGQFTLTVHDEKIMSWIDATLNIAEKAITLQRVPHEIICTPTELTIPDLIIPGVSGMYQYSYRVNDGEIITNYENVRDAPAPTVFVNILAYYGLFNELVTHYTANGSGNKKAFFVEYGQPIKGGSVDHPNMISAQSNTIEFLLTPTADHDLIQAIFGEAITLQSCAVVDWVTNF